MSVTSVTFGVNLGGIDTEAITSKTFFPSPQLRKINASTTDTIPIIIVPERTILRVKHISWKVFSAQAKQDLTVEIQIGSENIIESGKLDSIGKRTQETRLTANTGIPYNSIASTTGIGFPDNFMPKNDSTYMLVFETELLSAIVKNQSDVYNHGILIEVHGWLLPTVGRSKSNIIKELAKFGRMASI